MSYFKYDEIDEIYEMNIRTYLRLLRQRISEKSNGGIVIKTESDILRIFEQINHTIHASWKLDLIVVH